MQVESFIIASQASQQFEDLCKTEFNKAQDQMPVIKKMAHDDFKKYTEQAKVIIRTGEASPYYNIILNSGVTF